MTIKRRAFLFVPLLTGCSRSTTDPPVRRYALRGEVVRVEAGRNIAVIRHENIEGWMEAMTMEFPVRDKAELAKLAKGRRIRATVNVQDLDYWLSDIQPQ